MGKKTLVRCINFIFIAAFLSLAIWMVYYFSTHNFFNLEIFKKTKIAVLCSAGVDEDAISGFRDGMFERGYSDGKNIIYLVQTATSSATLAAAADNLAVKEPDAVFSIGPAATAEAKARFKNGTPIVFTSVGDPIQAGFVNSYSATETSLAGCADLAYETAGKRLEIFKQALPSLKKVFVFYDAENMASRSNMPDLRMAADALGIELVERSVKDARAAESDLSDSGNLAAEGIFIYPEPAISSEIGFLLSKANEVGLPSMAYASGMIDKGATLSYGTDMREEARKCAVIMEQVIKGKDLKNLPVLSPEKFEFIVNSSQAKKMGLTIDPEAIKLADKVIE